MLITAHVKRDHAKEYAAAEEAVKTKAADKKVVPITNFFGAQRSKNKWSKTSEKWKNLTMAIANWFVKDSRPAAMVEDEGFIRFMELAQPDYSMPCANTITGYIEKLYIKVKEEVMAELKKLEFCTKTTDGGSSSNSCSFQETGVHDITEDFQMKYFTLAVRECKGEHTAVNYRKHTDKVEEEFEIRDKIVMTTTDNENKMRCAYNDDERTGCLSYSPLNS